MPPRISLLAAIRHAHSSSSASLSSASRARDGILCSSPFAAAKFGTLTAPVRSYQKRMSSTGGGSGGKRGAVEGQDAGEVPLGSNQDLLPDVSEEAAQTARILEKRCGEIGGPELEQGTPVEEILSRDKDALKNMPKVIRDQFAAKNSGGQRSFSTSTRVGQQELRGLTSNPSPATVAQLFAAASNGTLEEPDADSKSIKLPRSEHLKRRYEPLVDQFTKLLMQDGKLSLAQRNMSKILDHLRTSPPPAINPTRPLLPGPPAPQLSLNPILYLTLIVDSVAPVIKVRQLKGAGGGGTALPLPHPLRIRQRRRTAIKWILEASEKRRDSEFARRVANEVVAVAEGRSSVWEKRNQTHKSGTAARANIRYAKRK